MATSEPIHEYVPGTCNIGGADQRARARIGWIAIVVSAVVAVGLLYVDVPPLAMLFVAAPTYVGAISLLQARARFCVGFAAAGRYGFDLDKAGPTGDVTDDADRKADRVRARQLNARAAQVTLLVTAASILLAAIL